jgi:O-antigen/teichoic acid export membrane protein
MNNSRKIAYNTGAQVFGKIIVAILAIISIRLSTKYLGTTQYGYLTIITALFTLFGTLTDWGLTTIAGREIARTPEHADYIIGLNVTIRTLFTIVVTPIIIFMGLLIYHADSPELKIGLVILSITLFTSTLQSSVATIFVAKMRNDLTAAIEVITKVLSVASILLVIQYDLGYYGYVWAMVIISIISLIITLFVTRRYVKLRPIFDVAGWKKAFLVSLPLGAVQIMNVVYFSIDSLLLSVMRTPVEVGYYGVSYNVISYVMLVPSMFMLSAMPALSTATRERLKVMIQKAFDAMTILGIPIFVGGVLLAKYIILGVSNADFLPAVPAFQILMIGAGTSFIGAVFGNAMVATDNQNRLIRLTLIVMITNIVLNLILIPRFGISGAAAATTVTEIFSMFYVTYLFHKATGITAKYYQVFKSVLAGIGMLLAFVLTRHSSYLSQTGWPQLLILTAILGLVYGAILAAIGGLPFSLLRDLREG